MTYQDDPKLDRTNRRMDGDTTGYTGWIIGGIVAVAVILGIFLMFGREVNNNTAASNQGRPAATTVPSPASGTGTAGNTRAPAPNSGDAAAGRPTTGSGSPR